MEYISRIVDDVIDRKTEAFNAVSITGPKGCGKTRTARERCKTVIEFQDEDKREGYLAVAETAPKLFLKNPKPILFDEYAEKESYAGICDEVRIGVTLIFYLQNVVDFLAVKGSKKYMNLEEGVILGALSTEGKILLPINKTEKKNKQNQQNTTDRNYLVAAARDGDENAIENLTLEDIDTYSMLSRRITHEDVLSIVDSYFMPYGIESDQYAILGEILDCRLEQNNLTGENVWVLDICCNEMNFGVCINQKDLVGEPQVGRRFKGIVWMQGSIKYRE